MKFYPVFLFWFLSITAGFFTSHLNAPKSVVSTPDPNIGRLMPFKDPAGRSLLSLNAKQDVLIIASLDGTIYLVERDSQKVLSSFSSGPSLYSQYKTLPGYDTDEENSVGLDGVMEHYLNNNNLVDIKDLQKKFQMHVEEDFSGVRSISKDRVISNWSKKNTVFFVDAKSGTLLDAYKPGDIPSNLGVHNVVDKSLSFKQYIENLVESTAIDLKTVELLCITRTDYAMQYWERISGKLLSNMTFSEIEAVFLYQGIENSLTEDSLILKNDLVLGDEGDLRMSPRNMEVIVMTNPDTATILSSSQIGRLPKPNPKDGFPLQPRAAHQNEATLPVAIISQPMPSENNKSPYRSDWRKITAILKTPTFLGFLAIFFILVTRFMGLLTFTRQRSTMQLSDSKGRNSVVARRKKARKLGNNKNSSNTERNGKNLSSEEAIERANGFPLIEVNGKEPWSNLTKPVGDSVEGRMVGKLFVSAIEIAKGSNGTVVLEGIYDGRPVAIKRLVQTHHDVAIKEIQNLIASDRHPNVVRWYGVEHDSDFVYLALERCTCSLHDLIQICSNSSRNSVFNEDNSMEFVNEYNVRLDSVKGIEKDVALWKANGYPSTQLLKIMRDVVSGLAHLHELGIVHRDLKPQNVLIIKERSLCAKLSDMGISKRLCGEMSSLGHHATGYGSSGWQAPEQLLHGRQTRAVDLFSLGCVLFFCITGGRHPFGDRLERDINIVKDRVDLFMVEHIPEAVNLLSHLLDPDPELRIKALNVLEHPLFWNSETRLSFLRDASDRVELEDRENESDLLKALENVAPVALGGNWDEKLEATFITNIGHYRRYKFDSTRDLLRVIRNKLNHYRELPKEIQEILGPVPEGFDAYFGSRFPKLLIEVFKVVYKYCGEEECFRKYFKSNLI